MPKFVIIIVAVVVVIIFSAIRLAIKSSRHHFECPECGESFQVSFSKYMFTAHRWEVQRYMPKLRKNQHAAVDQREKIAE